MPRWFYIEFQFRSAVKSKNCYSWPDICRGVFVVELEAVVCIVLFSMGQCADASRAGRGLHHGRVLFSKLDIQIDDVSQKKKKKKSGTELTGNVLKKIQNTQEIKRTLFDKTEQDKTCKFSM